MEGAAAGARGARRVAFPEDDGRLVTSYLEPPEPFARAEEISSEDLSEEYVQSCRKHNTQPIEDLLKQLKGIGTLGGLTRRGTLNLSYHDLSPAACEALEAILRRTRFQRLDLHNCNLNDDAAIALFDMVEYYESCVELDISGNKGFGILAWRACSKMVSQCQWLEQLEIRETSLSESSAPVLGRGLRSLCSLRSLHLEQSSLSGPPLLCLAGVLKQNKSIRELHLGDNNLVASDARHLASMLRINSSLQLLDVSNNDIQDTGIEAIADALAEQSSKQSSSSSGSSSESSISSPQSDSSGPTQERGLVALIVWNNNLTRNSSKHFSKALTRCHSLEMLNIGQNPLCNETVNRMRGALQKNRSLLSLGMQSTRLSAEAAISLAEIIEDNPIIQRIDLRDNKLQAAGLLALATALKNNQTVTRIDLDDAPPIQADKEQPLEEARLVSEIRLLCNRNEADQSATSLNVEQDPNVAAQRRRIASFTTRKISLTCQTLHTPSEPILSPPKATSRFRSPLPSPIPSPISSPIPSPLHKSRFQVSRVSDSSSGTSQSPSPSTPPAQRALFTGGSRFKVVSVSEPPSISVQAPDLKETSPTMDVSSQTENAKYVRYGSSRFSIVRNVNVDEKPSLFERADRKKALAINALSDEKNAASKQNWTSNEGSPHKYPSTIKKNKSESSLDSPDLEVSRLMQNDEKRSNYDSSSSLDISGSSMESLSTLEINAESKAKTEEGVLDFTKPKSAAVKEHSLDSMENDVFGSVDDKFNRKLGNLSLSSNESSLDLSAPVEVPHHAVSNHAFLNSSVSSNESVSPNIFGKHMKLHGSVTSLEASVSSLDSFKSSSNIVSPTNQNIELFNFSDQSRLIDSTDSGIFQSENSPKTLNNSISSNDGTLTGNSNLSGLIQSFGSGLETAGNVDPSDTSKAPKRTSSLLDVPSSAAKQRNRKISWVASPVLGTALGSLRRDGDDAPQKPPSSLEKLLNLFQIPTNIFSRNVGAETSEKRDSNSSMSLPSTSGSFWPWSTNTNAPIAKPEIERQPDIEESLDPEEITLHSNDSLALVPCVSAKYTVKLADRRRHSSELSISDDNLSDSGSIENNMSPMDQPLSIIHIEEDPTEKLSNLETNIGLHEDNVHVLEQNSEVCEDGSIKSVNRISNELCDNQGIVEETVNVDSASVENLLDDKMVDVSVANCDTVNVQVDRNLTHESCTDNVTIFPTIPNDSIIERNSVQNNLLLNVCDNECRSLSVISGSHGQKDDEWINTNTEIPDLKTNDSDVVKQDFSEKDLSINSKREERERIISRDLSVCSVTSSVNTDTDNSPNTLDCYFVGSDNLLFDARIISPNAGNVSAIPHNAESQGYEISDAGSEKAIRDSNFTPPENESQSATKEATKEYVNLVQNEEPLSQPILNLESLTKDASVLSLDTELCLSSVSDDKNVNDKKSSESDKILECDLKDLIRPSNFGLNRNTVAANFSLEILPSSILKQSIGLENKSPPFDRQPSPESGPSVENLPIKIIKRIKENISPENTLTTSMSNTQALAQELRERRKILSQNSLTIMENLDMDEHIIVKGEFFSKKKSFECEDVKVVPTCEDSNLIADIGENPLSESHEFSIPKPNEELNIIQDYPVEDLENSNTQTDIPLVEEAKDALTLTESDKSEEAHRGDVDDDTQLSALERNEAYIIANEEDIREKDDEKPMKSILKTTNSDSGGKQTSSSPKNIPDHHHSHRHHCGSLPESTSGSGYSPKSLPDNLTTTTATTTTATSKMKLKSRSPINTLGKLARDSLYGLNMSEEEMSGSLGGGGLERVRSLGSVSEDGGGGDSDAFQFRRGYSSSESRSLGGGAAFASQDSLASSTSISEAPEEADSALVLKDTSDRS